MHVPSERRCPNSGYQCRPTTPKALGKTLPPNQGRWLQNHNQYQQATCQPTRPLSWVRFEQYNDERSWVPGLITNTFNDVLGHYISQQVFLAGFLKASPLFMQRHISSNTLCTYHVLLSIPGWSPALLRRFVRDCSVVKNVSAVPTTIRQPTCPMDPHTISTKETKQTLHCKYFFPSFSKCRTSWKRSCYYL